MPRYYFNVITANGSILDPEGTELRDLDHAQSEAIADARSLMSTAIKQGHTIFGRSISICNEAGEVLAVLPFSEAVKAFD